MGDAFGFYASSMSLPLARIPDKSFWKIARQAHKKIHTELAKTDIFRMLLAEHLPPSLLDSLYFSKYGSLKNKLALKMLQRMKWDKVSYGYSITNVGRVNIPENYGKYILEAVYGPFLYSDVNEKVVGVITISGKLTFSFSNVYSCDNESI